MRSPAQRRLVRSSRAARAHLAVAIALGAATAALVVVQAVLLAGVIDDVFRGHAGPAAVRGALIALVAVAVARGLVAFGFEVAGRLGAARVMSELRGRLVRHLLADRPGGLAGERAGELASVAVSGVDALEPYFARLVPAAVLAALVPPAILAWAVPLDWQAAAILAVSAPLVVVFMILIGKAAAARTRARWRTLGVLSAHFLDVVEGLQTLRANDRAGAQEATLRRVGDRYRAETMGTLRVAFLSALVLELVAMLGTALVAATIGVQLVEGQLGFRAGLTVLILAPEVYLPLRQLGAQFHASADGLAAAERIFAVLDEPATVAVSAVPRPAPDPARAPVRLEGVAFAHPGREGTLRDVDLELAPGELVALVGPSGAGKSTLASLLLRLADPHAGRVTCAGVDLRDVDPRDWRRRVAWVPQRPTLFAGTVADNIRLAAPAAGDDAVRAAAAAAAALEVVQALPDGFATRVGEGGRPLSAGQAQRIALARAFLADAPLLVLDEPTAHLDEATAAAVDAAIGRLAAGRTTLLIVHRPALAARADRVVTLAGGRLHAASPSLEAAA
ncbi:MAG TPA: thiol reductant ABC exporter subunit CydD [Solirubrobacteraceae bacterium]|nr:thiol reductant ABC exporter subunit CydD [Solirubrobacteraceae bacterium]